MSNYGGSRSTKLMDLVYATYEPMCHLCGKWIDLDATGNYGPSVDHLIARSFLAEGLPEYLKQFQDQLISNPSEEP